jgi:hypothetical protein
MATGFLTDTATVEDRTVQKVGQPTVGRAYHQIDYADGWGTTLDGNDALVIGASTTATTGTSPITIEIWAKSLADATGYLFDSRNASNTGYSYFGRTGTTYAFPAGTTAYANGSPISTNYTWRTGEWTLFHFVANQPTSTPIHIGQTYQAATRGQYQIGHVAVYDKQLTAAQVAAVYQTYTGVPTTRYNDASIIAASVPGDGASIYAYDWSIQPAG